MAEVTPASSPLVLAQAGEQELVLIGDGEAVRSTTERTPPGSPVRLLAEPGAQMRDRLRCAQAALRDGMVLLPEERDALCALLAQLLPPARPRSPELLRTQSRRRARRRRRESQDHSPAEETR